MVSYNIALLVDGKIRKSNSMKIKSDDEQRRSQRKAVHLAGLKMRSRVRKMLVDSVPYYQIKIALKLSTKSFNRYKEQVCKSWEENEIVDSSKARVRRIAQLENIAQKAAMAWEDSKKNSVETTTTLKLQVCPECKGKKEDKNGIECPLCDGVGEIKVEIVTQKVKGKVGDAAFLKEQRASVEMMAKLEGLSAPQKIEHLMKGSITHEHKTISDDNQYKDADPDKILKLIAVQEEIEDDKKSSKQKESDIIDVKILNIVENGDYDEDGNEIED